MTRTKRSTSIFALEDVALDELRPHPRNYRAHPPAQLAHLVASLRAHGFYKNVVVARDGTILAGHGVVLAAREAGKERVPILRLDLDPDDPRALKVLAGDNEIQRGAEADDRALSELLKEVMAADGLVGSGFDEKQLAALALVTRPASEIGNEGDAAEWVGLPGFEGEDARPKLVIAFETDAARAEFMAKVGITTLAKKTGLTWSALWPPQEREDLASVRFEST